MEFFIVANPTFIPLAFAENGLRNVIQKTRQPNQDAQDMTLSDGSPLITLTPIEDGGKAPKGQDFNGIMHLISTHTVFNQNGGRYKWDPNVVTEFGGYNKDAIVQSQDGLREYISLIPNNPTNPDSNTTGTWAVYSGNGSIPVATSTVAGIMTVINNLTSTNVGSALSAAMGRALSQAIDLKLNTTQALGINQTWADYTSSRSLNSTYYSPQNQPIEIRVSVRNLRQGISAEYCTITIGGVVIPFAGGGLDVSGAEKNASISITIPPNTSYRVSSQTSGTLVNWSELR